MKAETAKLGAYIVRLNQKIAVEAMQTARHLFRVYYGYESDQYWRFFSVISRLRRNALTMTRCENKAVPLDTVGLCAGKYSSLFSGTGEIAQVVINVWGDIWRLLFKGNPIPRESPKVSYGAFTTVLQRYTSSQ